MTPALCFHSLGGAIFQFSLLQRKTPLRSHKCQAEAKLIRMHFCCGRGRPIRRYYLSKRCFGIGRRRGVCATTLLIHIE
eukprot:scaffold1941_cov377-Prasinococcus_capsulatus_cf.AAC.5